MMEKKNTKLSLRKIKIAKLPNMHTIRGGNDGAIVSRDSNDTGRNLSFKCGGEDGGTKGAGAENGDATNSPTGCNCDRR